MVDRALCFLTATEALAAFRRRELSPVELLEAQLGQIAQAEPVLNAFCSQRTELAMEQARAAERTYATQPDAARALEGLPTVLKNEHSLIGEHTDQGSLLLGQEPDAENAPITQRLLDAGVVIHARTNVPEFYVAAFTASRRYGVTRNPWNTAYTCGGSSGGAGVALAAGMTTLATGSDIGGSIRVPSAYCGVVGFKPSYGRVPEGNMMFAMNAHNHNGLLARSVADAVLMYNVIAGPHRADPASIRPKALLSSDVPSVKGLRIALSMDLGFFDVSPDIRHNTLEAAQRLREQGAIVEEVDLGWTANVRKAFTDGLVFVLGNGLIPLVEAHREQLSYYVTAMAERAKDITVHDYLASFDEMARMHTALQDVYERYDVMICPTLARNETPAEGAPEAHENLMHHGMTYPFNMLSRHPVLAVPTGFASHGVPTGLQIVGQTFDEPRVIQVGMALERSIGWTGWRPAAFDGSTNDLSQAGSR